MAVVNMRREVQLKDLKVTFFVRDVSAHAAIEATIKEYMTAMEFGAVFPDILISPTLEVIDGRLRLEAMKRLGHETCMVEVLPQMSELEYLSLALTSNAGVGLRSSNKDLTTVIRCMLEKGASDSEVVNLLKGTYPQGQVKKSLQHHHSNDQHVINRKIRALVARGGHTVESAAKEMAVPIEVARNAVERKLGEDKDMSIHKRIKGINQSHGQTVSKIMDDLSDAYEGEHVTEEQLRKHLKQITNYGKSVKAKVETFEKRFNQKVTVAG